MENIEKNIKLVLQQIHVAEQKYQREMGSVSLLAVSKTQPTNIIKMAISAGLMDFGENYLQEALPKIQELGRYQPNWYFIGPVQSNKTRQIAENFDWVLTVDKEKIAMRLGDARPPELGPLNICIQINISGEESKSGAGLSDIDSLIPLIMEHPQLRLRGLMGIPALETKLHDQRSSLRQLREIFESMQKRGVPVDTLSMGMSNDLEAAIAEGATMVRIGTSIFGQRINNKKNIR